MKYINRPLLPRETAITYEIDRNRNHAKTRPFKPHFAPTSDPWRYKKYCPNRKVQAKANAKLALPKLGPTDEQS